MDDAIFNLDEMLTSMTIDKCLMRSFELFIQFNNDGKERVKYGYKSGILGQISLNEEVHLIVYPPT